MKTALDFRPLSDLGRIESCSTVPLPMRVVNSIISGKAFDFTSIPLRSVSIPLNEPLLRDCNEITFYPICSSC
jgi:hypothetical protein